MSCGKKSSLDKYPGSDYPRNYPNNDLNFLGKYDEIWFFEYSAVLLC